MTVTPSAHPIERGADLTATLAAWARTLSYEDIPAPTLAAARSQLISNIAAVRASMDHPTGQRIVAAFGPPTQPDPKQSAYVLAALASLLDFDEVAFSGHVSTGAVNVAIAEARHAGLNGRSLLTTIVAANECAARITAATILSPFFRGQTNSHCHLASAAAARLHARRASLKQWTAALSLALGIVPVPVHRAVVDSDVKALAAAAPVRMALDACDAAASGLTGPDVILEHPEGLLSLLSAVPIPELVTAGLGRRWHTDTLTYKRFPGSAYLHSAFDCAERLHQRIGHLAPENVERVTVHASQLTCQLQRKIASALRGPHTSVSAATLSLGYGVATLLIGGQFGPKDLTPQALNDDARWKLAAKVDVVHDVRLSLRMAQATSPLGEALRQAGDRALNWPELRAWQEQQGPGHDAPTILATLGAPQDTFEDATMAIGARIDLLLVDGTALTEQCDAFAGSAGPATRHNHAALVGGKFLDAGGSRDALADLEAIDTFAPLRTAAALERALGHSR